MKTLYFATCCILSSLLLTYCTPATDTAQAEETAAPTYVFVNQHAPVWEEAIKQLEELADAMPEEMYGYKPHDSLMTFAEQLVHIGGASKLMANMFLKDIQPDGPPPAMDASAMSREELKTFVTTSMKEAGEIMKTMSDEQLQEEVKSFSGKMMTRQQALLFIHDHLTNHKAKANLYIRTSGNEPPSYRYY
jgi:uncharacterized damage-inducible protein DinB